MHVTLPASDTFGRAWLGRGLYQLGTARQSKTAAVPFYGGVGWGCSHTLHWGGLPLIPHTMGGSQVVSLIPHTGGGLPSYPTPEWGVRPCPSYLIPGGWGSAPYTPHHGRLGGQGSTLPAIPWGRRERVIQFCPSCSWFRIQPWQVPPRQQPGQCPMGLWLSLTQTPAPPLPPMQTPSALHPTTGPWHCAEPELP